MMEPLGVSRRELRQFGLIFAAFFLVVFGGLLPWLADRTPPLWPFVLATVVGLTALIWPPALKPLYRVWMKFGEVMGRVNSFLILSLLFFLMVTPIGWLMRLSGKDPLRRRLDRAAVSYRVASQASGRDHMEKPY